MMASWNGNISRVTGPLCGKFTGPGELPTQRTGTRSFDVSFDLRLSKRLSKQPPGWWFETPSWSLWRHRNGYSLSRHGFIRFKITTVCSLFTTVVSSARVLWDMQVHMDRQFTPIQSTSCEHLLKYYTIFSTHSMWVIILALLPVEWQVWPTYPAIHFLLWSDEIIAIGQLQFLRGIRIRRIMSILNEVVLRVDGYTHSSQHSKRKLKCVNNAVIKQQMYVWRLVQTQWPI